jgi:hypothetical protein
VPHREFRLKVRRANRKGSVVTRSSSSASDRVTDFVGARVSRRGFLGKVAKLGAAMGLAIGGMGALGGQADAAASSWSKSSGGTAGSASEIPGAKQICPPNCTGVCSNCFTACISGGASCSFTCDPGCSCLPGEAYGYWLNNINGLCVFFCALQPC